jgi:hypothetical protein
MYIEFDLTNVTNVGGVSALADYEIDYALAEWSRKYNISYNVKNIKQFKRVTFEQDEYYSLFALTWNHEKQIYALSKWRIVSDLNNKIEFNSVL